MEDIDNIIFDDLPLTDELAALLQNSEEIISQNISPEVQTVPFSASSSPTDQQLILDQFVVDGSQDTQKRKCVDFLVDNKQRRSRESLDDSWFWNLQRELNKNGEKRRRDKMNDHLKELQSILFPQGKHRVTKEEVLEQAIQQLRHRQFVERIESREAKRTKLITSSSLQDVPINEMEIAFNVLLRQTYKGLMAFDSKRNKHSFLTIFHTLEELAVKANNPQLSIMLHGIGVLHNGFVTFQPQEVEHHGNKCLQLYYSTQMKQKQNNHKVSPIILGDDGADVGVVTLMLQAMTQGAMGNIEKSIKTWRDATNLARVSCNVREVYYSLQTLNHPLTNIYMGVEKMVLHYHTGQVLTPEDITEIEALRGVPCFGTLSYGFLQLAQATSKLQKLEGLRAVESGVTEFEQIFGKAADLCLGAFLLSAYLISEEYDKGIQCANMLMSKLATTGIEGAYGRAELLRLKGDLLFLKYKSDLSPDMIQQIESIFNNAIQSAREKGTMVIHLRSLTSLAKFYLHAGTQLQKDEIKQQLVETCASLQENLPDLKNVQALLEELSLT